LIKRLRPSLIVLFSTILGLSLSSLAKADLIYSDLGPSGAPYFDANGRQVTGSGVGFPGFQEVAVAFTPTGNFNVTQLDLAVTFSGIAGAFGTDDATVSLASDNSGTPGTILGSWSISGLPPSSTGTALDTIAVNNLAVSASTRYWIIVSPNSSSTDDIWATNSNLSGVFGNEEINQGSSWASLAPYDLAAFDVQGTAAATPEPSSAALALCGMALGVAGWARKRCKS
jgi:hypothetical protein